MLLRISSHVFRISWWLLAAGIVLLALLLVVSRLVVLTMSDNRGIEELLRDRGFDYVGLGEVEGDWQVHNPTVSVEHLTFGPQGETALEVDRVVLKIDTFRSLFSISPIVSRIRLDGVRFTIEAYEDGTYGLRGFGGGDGFTDLDMLLDSLPHIEGVEFSGVSIRLEGHVLSGTLVSTPNEPMVVSSSGAEKQLSFPLTYEPDSGGQDRATVRLVGSYEGDPRDDNFAAELYLKTEGLNLTPAFRNVQILGRSLETASLDSETWIRIQSGDIDVTGSIKINNVSLDETVVADAIQTDFRFTGPSWNAGVLAVPAVGLKHEAYEFDLTGLGVAMSGTEGGRLAGSIAEIDVADIAGLLDHAGGLGLLPDRFMQALDKLSPGGRLRETVFSLDIETGDARLVSQLEALSIDAYLGVPAIDRLSGLISIEPQKGHLDIHNDEFEMYFSNMFSAPWPFDSGSGRVAFNLQDGMLRVNSGLIELIDGDLTAYGKVLLNLPSEQLAQTWGLTIGIANADLQTANRYVPNTISDDLRGWLERAIKRGDGKQAGLTFHGSLFRGSPSVSKSHDLYFRVEDTELEYHEAWPLIEDLAGTVHVNSYSVAADGVTARVYDSDIVEANVMVPISAGNQADTVLIDGELRGALNDGLRVLNETPLSVTTGQMAKAWNGDGQMLGKLTINVPVGDRREEEVYADVTVSLDDNSLRMPEFDLTIDQLSGDISYSNDRGLTSPAFTGMTFAKPISGKIASTQGAGSGEIRVNVLGSIDVEDLYEWSDQLLLTMADGTMDYETTIHVPFGQTQAPVYVEAASSLVGVTTRLPAPLDKLDAGLSVDFTYRQTFSEDSFFVDMTLGNEARASLKIEEGIAVGGRVHFGEEAFGAVAYDAIRMSGNVPYVNFEAWQEVTDTLGNLSDVSLEDEIAEHVAALELEIGELMVFELPLLDVSTTVTRNIDRWEALLSNDMLHGNVIVPDAEEESLAIHLDRLSFEGEDDDSDPFQDVDPREMIDIDFSTAQLLLDGEDYGAWSFLLNVRDGVARFDRLKAESSGVNVLDTSYAEWRFDGDGHNSRFSGSILVDDLAETLRKFGYASSIEGRGLKIDTDVNWPGSPAMVDVNTLSGAVDILEGEGRFVQAETGGALKMLGIFDFASLARRFRFDFSDVLDEGIEFNDISGGTAFETGYISVTDPVVIEGTGGRFTVGGTVDLNTRELDNDMIVTLPVSRTLPWYAAYSAIATGPLAGAGVWLAQKLFENQIDQMSSAKYKIGGTIDAPEIEFVSIFDDEVREAPVAQK